MKKQFRAEFLQDSSNTGRMIIKSLDTGKEYYVEAIGSNKKVKWGDVDPATDKVTGSYGQKYTGSIDAMDSMITEENGFKDIRMAENWSDIWKEIERRDVESD